MLSDREIIRRLISDDPEYGIFISPVISAPEQIGPSSIDVHLGTEFVVVERSDRGQFDALMEEPEYKEWLKHVRTTNRYSVLEKFILHPGEFALSATLEFIVVPPTLVAHIDGRSSWARQGLKVHATAGNIHPGSRGPVVFELENAGPVPIVLYPGLAIAQLTFEAVDGKVLEDYDSRPQSSYSGVLEMLWSSYPDDSVLRAMRQLKAGRPYPEKIVSERVSKSSKGSEEQFVDIIDTESAWPAAMPHADTVEMISGVIEILDPPELLRIAELLLPPEQMSQVESEGIAEGGLRELIHETLSKLAAMNSPSLRLLEALVAQYARETLGKVTGSDSESI